LQFIRFFILKLTIGVHKKRCSRNIARHLATLPFLIKPTRDFRCVGESTKAHKGEPEQR
jgi:hypothetical protein